MNDTQTENEFADEVELTNSPAAKRIESLEIQLSEAREANQQAVAALQKAGGQIGLLRHQRDMLAEALNSMRLDGNGCWCDACLAMHGAHPSHSKECNAARAALAAIDLANKVMANIRKP